MVTTFSSNQKLGHTLTSDYASFLRDLEHIMLLIHVSETPNKTSQKFCIDLYLILLKDPETMVYTL